MNPISLEKVGERKREKGNWGEIMLPEKKESKEKNKQHYEESRIIAAESLMMYPGERKGENENSSKSRISEKQDSSQELILLEGNKGLSDNNQIEESEKLEIVKRKLTGTIDEIQKPATEFTLMMKKIEQMEINNRTVDGKPEVMFHTNSREES